MVLKTDIPSRLLIDREMCIISYKGQPVTCFRCKKIGHLSSACPNKQHAGKKQASFRTSLSTPSTKEDDIIPPTGDSTVGHPPSVTRQEVPPEQATVPSFAAVVSGAAVNSPTIIPSSLPGLEVTPTAELAESMERSDVQFVDTALRVSHTSELVDEMTQSLNVHLNCPDGSSELFTSPPKAKKKRKRSPLKQSLDAASTSLLLSDSDIGDEQESDIAVSDSGSGFDLNLDSPSECCTSGTDLTASGLDTPSRLGTSGIDLTLSGLDTPRRLCVDDTE